AAPPGVSPTAPAPPPTSSFSPPPPPLTAPPPPFPPTPNSPPPPAATSATPPRRTTHRRRRMPEPGCWPLPALAPGRRLPLLAPAGSAALRPDRQHGRLPRLEDDPRRQCAAEPADAETAGQGEAQPRQRLQLR